MPGVLTDAVPQQDVLIRRGTDARWGVLWQQDAGAGFAPVDLIDWVGKLVLSSLSGDVWLEQRVATTSDGHAIAEVPAAVTAGTEWAGRAIGQWAITATSPDGAVVRLGEGTIRIGD